MVKTKDKLLKETLQVGMNKLKLECHRRNQAERAIQTFKLHFILILAGVNDKFPLSLWCHLLKPTKLTLNLLRQSKVAPKNILICPRPRPPQLHEKAICPSWMHNRSPRRTG
jgi:hypothetical protein